MSDMTDYNRRRFRPPDNGLIRGGRRRRAGDSEDLYVVHDDDIRLAVDVALATHRALLLVGPSGCGKSALARAVADHLGWRFYRLAITSHTRARDLLWDVDHIGRLHDAQVAAALVSGGDRDGERSGDDLSMERYVVPGPLWWAFDPDDAAALGRTDAAAGRTDPTEGVDDPAVPAVVLLDEIDKADPDVPNDLLTPVGSLRFRVDPLEGHSVEARAGLEPLLVVTSNEERDLSPAFLRRSVRLSIKAPTAAVHVRIATEHEPSGEAVARALAPLLVHDDWDEADRVSIATFVDAVRAAVRMELVPGTPEWDRLVEVFTDWRDGEGSVGALR